MGTQVLRPQDCLTSPAVFLRRRSCNYGNSYSNPRVNHRPNRKQQQHAARPDKPDHRRRAASEPAISKRSSSDDLRGAGSRTGLVMEKVMILRRGESLDSKLKNEAGSRNDGGDNQPPRQQVRAAGFRSPVACGRCDMYAGSAFAVSPEPSSLPLPSFSKKKIAPIDDSATRDLRRLLRLD
ncbi:uncharacterized protein LOC116212748 [Punica granatum]|uniref:Uncharacterized protein n=2 Tax=Punica granatum TaxID=22663 RepID=A0A218X050_PUNGR|nr:uncharacterized protein LOC116212748 [Punica granatum]OWM78535.1 hypothetical protein CDL15_Pgr016259 [Punica granatum]PKI68816.1 hypothetical protein CRG98_010873 [Punica granatum]